MSFTDRSEAGRLLGERLRTAGYERPVVLGLPRGGVPVAFEVAQALGAPLDGIVVRKLGCPWQRELGLGALGEGGVRLLNDDLIRRTGVSAAELDAVIRTEAAELDRRVRRYRGSRARVDLAGRTAVIVDDGLATGFTARAAVEVARRSGAKRVVLAVPVAPASAVAELRLVADEVVCLESPDSFTAIGAYYDDFAPTADEEVSVLLADAAGTGGRAGAADWSVQIPLADGRSLPGELSGPTRPIGTVVFAHGSGSSRLSPRNVAVARALNRRGLATLLFDLLSDEEADDRARVFDIDLLAARLVEATRWVRQTPVVTGGPTIGYFGASTGAAAALTAAAELGTGVAAVVSRGGRPDLAAARLGEVVAPTLLIVGERDPAVLDLNRQAQRQLRCEARLEIVAGASHLFGEPGTLDRVAELAGDWFSRHLAAQTTS